MRRAPSDGGDAEQTSILAKHLFDRTIQATALSYPVVPKGQEEIRFQVSAAHTEEDIDYVLQVLADAATADNRRGQ